MKNSCFKNLLQFQVWIREGGRGWRAIDNLGKLSSIVSHLFIRSFYSRQIDFLVAAEQAAKGIAPSCVSALHRLDLSTRKQLILSYFSWKYFSGLLKIETCLCIWKGKKRQRKRNCRKEQNVTWLTSKTDRKTSMNLILLNAMKMMGTAPSYRRLRGCFTLSPQKADEKSVFFFRLFGLKNLYVKQTIPE